MNWKSLENAKDWKISDERKFAIYIFSRTIKQRKNVWNCNFYLALFLKSFLRARVNYDERSKEIEIVDLMCNNVTSWDAIYEKLLLQFISCRFNYEGKFLVEISEMYTESIVKLRKVFDYEYFRLWKFYLKDLDNNFN